MLPNNTYLMHFVFSKIKVHELKMRKINENLLSFKDYPIVCIRKAFLTHYINLEKISAKQSLNDRKS